jgi:hypothetical protein
MALENGSWGYWLNTVHTKPEARELAARLQLHMPRGEMHGFKAGLVYPMRRLIISGEDTPANMATLFGPTWANETNGVKKIHHDTRIEVLLCPPPTSPSHTVATSMDQDYTGPWRPRGPSQEEQETLAKVREIGRIMNS